MCKTFPNPKIKHIFEIFKKNKFKLMCFLLLYEDIDDILFDIIVINDVDLGQILCVSSVI